MQDKKIKCYGFCLILSLYGFSCKKTNTSFSEEKDPTSSSPVERLKNEPIKLDVLDGKGPGNQTHILRIPLSAFRDSYKLAVFRNERMHIREAAKALEAAGRSVIAMVNGGFFNEKDGTVISYYQARFLKAFLQKPEFSGSPLYPQRTCLVIDKNHISYQNSPADRAKAQGFYESLRESSFDVLCGGPRLISKGSDVSERSLCDEQFVGTCRSDGQSPLDHNESTARTASCITSSDEFLLMISSSSYWRMGSTITEIAKVMLDAGCVEGMLHDGGSSSAFLYQSKALIVERSLPWFINRTVPTWLTVLRTSN